MALSGCGNGGSDGERTAATTPVPVSDPETLVVYSGRDEALVGDLLSEFSSKTGIEHEVRYGETSSLAAAIAREGKETSVDILIFEGVGPLGELASVGLLDLLPQDIQARVPFRYQGGYWIGTSGRARAIAFDKTAVSEANAPDSVFELTKPEYSSKVGWAPGDGSFQTFVTALRRIEGESEAERWLREMKANGTRAYESDRAIVEGIAAGEIAYGLVDHQDVAQARAAEGGAYPVAVHEPTGGDPGALVDVAGVTGIANAHGERNDGEALMRFLFSHQRRLLDATREYPLARGVKAAPGLTPLAEIEQPDVHLSELDDSSPTVDLLRRTGLL